MKDEIIKNGTKVLVKGDSENPAFYGTIVGSNEEDSTDFGLHYYIVPDGGNRVEDEMMFKKDDFDIIQNALN